MTFRSEKGINKTVETSKRKIRMVCEEPCQEMSRDEA